MRFIEVNIHSDGSVHIHGLDRLLVLNNDTEQMVRVSDRRTLTDSSQYNIGWHDGYRAQFNEKNSAEYLEKDKRMVASLKTELKDSIGG